MGVPWAALRPDQVGGSRMMVSVLAATLMCGCGGQSTADGVGAGGGAGGEKTSGSSGGAPPSEAIELHAAEGSRQICPVAMVVGDDTLYWIAGIPASQGGVGATVWSISSEGGVAQQLAGDATRSPVAIDFLERSLYFATWGKLDGAEATSAIFVLSSSGGVAEELATVPGLGSIAAVPSGLYFTSELGIQAVRADQVGQEPQLISSAEGRFDELAVDGASDIVGGACPEYECAMALNRLAHRSPDH